MAFLLFFAFGLLCSSGARPFHAARDGNLLADLFHAVSTTIAGLWFGPAFVAIGLGITALTLIGYFFVTGAAFHLWMAVVNGGGLILGGLWMRWS